MLQQPLCPACYSRPAEVSPLGVFVCSQCLEEGRMPPRYHRCAYCNLLVAVQPGYIDIPQPREMECADGESHILRGWTLYIDELSRVFPSNSPIRVEDSVIYIVSSLLDISGYSHISIVGSDIRRGEEHRYPWVTPPPEEEGPSVSIWELLTDQTPVL